ncbi:DUF6975 family protein [Sphingomonas sp. PAMC 26605]|uniref:DUF6975 family protein n=1 Tax=Sphingomonas sp. PAMC 26605 TaxID=1112214 RepID=UPI00026CCB81|nr:hypothetical protein [Sphingomonas sp. PAMC 26605]
MASASTQTTKAENAGSIAGLAVADGVAGHSLFHRLTAPGVAGRDLADTVHALCSVHGRLNALFDEAAQRSVDALDQRWMTAAGDAFQIERAYLAHLTAAVGPLPSTPGQAESDAAFAAQRHTFDMLARSDRAGCSTGAALALVIDWHAFRTILDAAAHRAGTTVTPTQLPTLAEAAAIAAAPGASPGVHRAMAFGAQQTFAQHRGLCDLIESRAIARDRL